MKLFKLSTFLLLFTLISLSDPAQEFLISEGGTVTTCSAILYDSGGLTGEYENNEDYSITFCAPSPDECMQLDVILFDIESGFDDLFVYGGPDSSGELIAELTGELDPMTISTGYDCVTIVFQSDISVVDNGFAIAVSCGTCPTCDDGIQNGQELGVDCGGPDCPECDFTIIGEEALIVSCNLELFDSGGVGPYSDNENLTTTVCSDGTGTCLQLDFLDVDIAFGDHLYVYDGNSIGGPLLADITNTTDQDPIVASQDCVTLNFVSSTTFTAEGFDVLISCTGQCPTCEDGIQNGAELGIDCGGPDCPDCTYIVMSGNIEGTTCDAQVFDNGIQGNYSDDSDDVLTLCAAIPGECMQFDFQSFELENNYDYLYLYAGPDLSAPLIGTYTAFDSPGIVNAGTECLTARFTSDGSVTRPGFEFIATCLCPSCDDGILNGQELATDCGGPDCPDCTFNAISEGGNVISCESTLYDSGVESTYDNDEDYVMTFCNPDDVDSLFLAFQQVQIGIGDHLYIYDGTDLLGELIADISAAVNWPDMYTPSSCVTFHFTSNATGISQGFEIDISCADDILNSLPEARSSDFEIQLSEEGLISISHPIETSFEVELYDISGRLLIDRRLANGEQLDVSAIRTQACVLIIQTDSGQFYSQKLIFRH